MSGTAKLRQVGVGVKLRELREKTGMTTRSVASSLGVSPSSVSRTEMGQRIPNRDEMNALCALYGVTGDEKVLLVEKAATPLENTAWLELASREPGEMTSLTVLEREARSIKNVEVALIPGLAQTPDYSRLMMSTVDVPDQDLDQRVATRLGRQALLSRRCPPEVSFFVDEGALRRTLGDTRLMREQLEHLLVVQRRDRVTLRVIPLDARAHPAMDGSFTLYELSDGELYVFVESRVFGVFLTEPADVDPFVEACRTLEDHALDESGSNALIEKIMRGLADE